MSRKEQEFSERIGQKAARKRRARRADDERVWFGLGLFGLVGWSVAVPTLLGLALGIWIDTRWPGQISWTLTLMMAGLILGCLNAWFWVEQERREIIQRRTREDEDEDE
jgi:ATP synthase protein I